MKKIIILFLLVSLTSCYKIVESDPIVVKSTILNKQHEDEKTEYSYHYGFSMIKGNFCWHYGPETTPEKNIVTFNFLNETLSKDDISLYNKNSNELTITYVEVYRVKKDVKTFLHNNIIKIE